MSSSYKASQIDYSLRTEYSPVYKFLRVPLNLPTSSTINISDSAIRLEFKLPSTRVYNLNKSMIGYNLNVPAQGVGSVIYSHEDVFTLGSEVFFGTAGGTDLCNLHYANNYTKISTKQNTKIDDFLSADNSSQLYPCNEISTSNAIAGPTAQTGTVSFTEPNYLSQVPDNTELDKYVQFPLSNLTKTIFAYDKDLHFGNEMYIRIQTCFVNKMVFQAASPNAPQSVPLPAGTPPLPLISKATINNVYLYLAVEQNDIINASIMDKFARNEFKINMPYTVGFLNTSNSAIANINIQITKQYGKRLLQIVHSVFNANNTGVNAYDCCNNNAVQKLLTYRTNLDSTYLQDYPLKCTPSGLVKGIMGNDDWYLSNQKFCKGTAILNRDVYSKNWFHMDRFYEENDDISSDNLDVGLLLTPNTMNYIVECNLKTNDSM